MPTTTDATGIAMEFIEARNQRDAGRMMELLATHGNITQDITTRIENYPIVVKYEAASDWRWTVTACQEKEKEETQAVTCNYTMNNTWSIALGHDEVQGSMNFFIQDGLISSFHHNFNLGFWSPNVFTKFRSWIFNNHPESAAIMFGANGVNFTDEAFELFEKHSADFVEAMQTGN